MGFVCLFFLEMWSHCVALAGLEPGWPGTHIHPPASSSWVLGLRACPSTPCFVSIFSMWCSGFSRFPLRSCHQCPLSAELTCRILSVNVPINPLTLVVPSWARNPFIGTEISLGHLKMSESWVLLVVGRLLPWSASPNGSPSCCHPHSTLTWVLQGYCLGSSCFGKVNGSVMVMEYCI